MNDNPAQFNSELPQPQTHNNSKVQTFNISKIQIQPPTGSNPGLNPGLRLSELLTFKIFSIL